MAAIGTFTPGGRVGRLIVRGPSSQVEVSTGVLSGSLNLTTSEVSKLGFTVQDRDGALLGSRIFDLRNRVDYAGLQMSIAAVATTEVNGIAAVTVTARTLGVQRLREDRKTEIVNGLSKAQFVEKLVKSAGLKFYGQPSPREPGSIIRGGNRLASGAELPGGEKVESAWEAIVRLAAELGYIAFEAAGTVYFGQPTWLITRLPQQTVVWRGAKSPDGLLRRPECRRTTDDPLRSVTVDLSLLGDVGEKLRPGMALKLGGVPTFDGLYLISSVTIALEETVPTSVKAVYPTDPAVQGGPEAAAAAAVVGPDGVPIIPPSTPPGGGSARTDRISTQGFRWPVGGRKTSGFGQRNGRPHTGIDIGVPTGTPVLASADGRVAKAGSRGGYGLCVEIDHGGGITTLYAHNSVLRVSTGQSVNSGQVIALAGSTGHSTGPHVHFEIRIDGVPRNPENYLPR